MRRLASLTLIFLLTAGAAHPVSAQDDLARRGLAAFMKNGCHGCHTIGKVGSRLAPDLSHIGRKHGAAYLRQWLRDPQSLRPSAHMPALELTEADIDLLAVYLSTLP
ncbi:MAG TPA: c-type cytochrome [Candidatus Limnocylindria bacterium]|nr:c-type cytochrome [Candidatus Limnocylindria bacterium]